MRPGTDFRSLIRDLHPSAHAQAVRTLFLCTRPIGCSFLCDQVRTSHRFSEHASASALAHDAPKQTVEGAHLRSLGTLARSTEKAIDWSKVSGVIKNQDKPIVEWPGFGWAELPTEELPVRVQYAMEFLKNACDQTARTGF